MNCLDSDHIGYLLSRGLAVDPPIQCGDLAVQSVYVYPFSRTSKLTNGSPWNGPVEHVPPTIPPVTEPADQIALLRQRQGWPPDRPIYNCIRESRLRLWNEDGDWFVDDSTLHFSRMRVSNFTWRFDTLEEAVNAIVRRFAEIENARQVPTASSEIAVSG